MGKFRVTGPDGQAFDVQAPDGATPEQVHAMVLQHLGQSAPAAAPAAPTVRQQVQASAPVRLAYGLTDPLVAAGQLLAHGAAYVANAGGLAPNRVGKALDQVAREFDGTVRNDEADMQASREATAPVTLSTLVTGKRDPGVDAMRLAGNVLSPVNAAAASKLPAATTTLGRVVTGIAGGSIGGALQPVVSDGDNFGARKAAQVGLGAVTGGLAAPVLGAITDRVSQAIANAGARRAATRPPSVEEVEAIARRVANDTGQRWEDLGPQMQQQLGDQVRASMREAAGRLDPAAVARRADFQAEGMQPTLGQLTRDGRQFANERNLRQLPGTGDPLLQRFEQQGTQLQQKVGAYGRGAQQDYPAGNALIGPLRAYDEKLSTDIRSAYRAARDSAGKDAELPLQGLAQDAADVLDNFGDKVPSGVLNQLKKYGILPGQEGNPAPRKLFTVEEADKLLKVINASGSRTDDATNAALAQLRGAVKKAVTEPGADDVFAPARKLAAERFALHDSVGALQAVARGRADPDTFVRNFVINGKTDETVRLAGILQKESPEAYQQARAQIGAELGRAAFGQNVTGDKAMSVERYMKALNDLGDDKLRAFFTAKEIEQMHRLGRLGGYINQAPNSAPVNTSGNWGAIMGLAARIPGMPAAIGLAKSAQTAIQNTTGAQRALAAQLPMQPAPLDPATVRQLADIIKGSGVASGTAAAQAVK